MVSLDDRLVVRVGSNRREIRSIGIRCQHDRADTWWREAKALLAKVLFTFTKGLLVANLVVGKKRPSARAADVVSPPGIHRPGQAATVRAGLGEARRDETVAALGQHLVDPSTGRRRIRRRPVPHQALRPPRYA